MLLKFMSVMVTDQEKALEFYTDTLGFTKMADLPMGAYRWLTVVSPDGLSGVELVLEPIGFEPAAVYQKALFEAGIPAAAFISKNIEEDYQRLSAKGVNFKGPISANGPIRSTVFDDTCGNWINLVQPLM